MQGWCGGGYKIYLDPIQRIFYSGSTPGKILCYCTVLFVKFFIFIHGLGNDRLWKKLNNDMLLQEKINNVYSPFV